MYNYAELCKLVPELKEHIVDGKLNYNDTGAVRLLNRALLEQDFGLKVNLPNGHLCPTVPNRTYYIKLLEVVFSNILQLSGSFLGVDIGTGASCVYPLIGCARNSNWSFIATDIDDEILAFASDNLNANFLLVSDGRIKLLKNPDSTRIFPDCLIKSIGETDAQFKFLVCNPPFYTGVDDLEERRGAKRFKPTLGQWSMTEGELSTELGGEFGFISQMIKESLVLPAIKEFDLFSCMLGLKESLGRLLNYLEEISGEHSPLSFAFQFLQIKHTTRYILMWSFSRQFPKDSKTHQLKVIRKTQRTQEIAVSVDVFDFQGFCKDLGKRFGSSQEYSTYFTDSFDSFTLHLTHNKWSRKSRRSPSNAFPLQAPFKIDISLQENSVCLAVESDVDWDTFVGFINHLRKELDLPTRNE